MGDAVLAFAVGDCPCVRVSVVWICISDLWRHCPHVENNLFSVGGGEVAGGGFNGLGHFWAYVLPSVNRVASHLGRQGHRRNALEDFELPWKGRSSCFNFHSVGAYHTAEK